MGSGRLIAVADTGPLIHLAEIGCLTLLEIFELHVSEVVWGEADRPPAIREHLTFALRHTLASEEVAGFAVDHRLEKLQRGEQESLVLCMRLGVPLLLTDDLRARNSAKSLGLTPVGSLGIIAKAQQVGRITLDAAVRYMRSLMTLSSLYVTPTIVELAIERLRVANSHAS